MSDSRDRQNDGRPPQQNVKPKLPSNNTGSTHPMHQRDESCWKEKPKVHRSRSIDSIRDRGRKRDRNHQGERRQRGRSEEARRRDTKQGEAEKRKKYVPENDIDDTECAICFCAYDNIFKTPKLLSCGHTFCLECLARINVTSMELKSLPCPVCREITQIPHGQDLPRLGTNQDILQKLPPQMQRILSIRFKRSQGKLMLKTQQQAHQQGAPMSPTNVKSLSTKKPSSPDAPVADTVDLELGVEARTVVNVGRPPNRVHGRLRRLFRSDRCYYTVVVTIITITVILMLIGILAFVIIPNVTMHRLPNSYNGNQTSGQGVDDSP
ncbi:E3 ubiquitin-protein ligase RNF183 [Periophthalmus magnuspinnatus]|uniref:E3 ubiquitin-protein ligase RNF183 n=1 Tax=Periophthalmus magnuspinnatus TaxID=409849 RepID=UPI00145BEA49|nr:E3 ubiquitin-protein ligase RNF183 [Periophthalmus magnuspinnatus]